MFNNTPLYLFISTGDKCGFYTLREMVRVVTRDGSYLTDRFIKTLSTDSAKADTLASEFSEYLGLPLNGNASFDLEEIKRRKSEEVERERQERERQEREVMAKREEEFQRIVGEACFVNGKYCGQTATEVAEKDIGYIQWLADQWSENLCRSKMTANVFIAHEWILENPIADSEFVGEEGQQITLELKFEKSYWADGRFPTLRHVCYSGTNVVMFCSTAKGFKELNPGDRFTVNALVEKHYTKWDGKRMTILKKPKIAK